MVHSFKVCRLIASGRGKIMINKNIKEQNSCCSAQVRKAFFTGALSTELQGHTLKPLTGIEPATSPLSAGRVYASKVRARSEVKC